MEPIVLVHGGAGNVRDSRVPPKVAAVKVAAIRGYEVLERGGSAVDAVEEAVRTMEDDECMNSGHGSVLNSEGKVEMDSSIMNGATMDAGCVAVVRDIAHPVSLARMVMEKTPYVMLAGEGAMGFAKEMDVEMLPPGALVTDDAQKALEIYKQTGGVFYEIGETETVGEVGTVGAVALDFNGHIAAATSTGGLNGKHPGRVGDSPIIGSGTYARDDVGAVSATGHGETISKWCLAHSIITAMQRGADPQTATETSLNQMTDKLKETAGAICISKEGKVGIGMTTKRMSWAYRKGDELVYGIDKGKQEVENVSAGSNTCSMG
ncbi:isoaspartyl peptidase/L-asparaginase-like isoform X2 [Coccinella septempunctata]|nr:isoaspartyl peptidase/L-asparaginase-like isoform X2 [Coccinella septempunctata]